MSRIIKRVAAIGAAVAIGAGSLALAAPSADAAKVYKKPGSATVKEGRKVVREADKQKCLTLKEAQKIVKGAGYRGEGVQYWYGKGKADYVIVEFDGSKCAQAAFLVYDNGDTYGWVNGYLMQWD